MPFMLDGVFPAAVTPFKSMGNGLDLDALKPYCDYLAGAGVHGVFACGTTGEGLLLTADEKIAMVETLLEALGGRGRIILQVVCADYPGTLKTARRAAQLGVDAISVIQPPLYSIDGEAQYSYIAGAVEAAGETPLYLYNIPGFTGNPLTKATLVRLLQDFPTIRGIKESGSLDNMREWLTLQSGRFQVVCGVDDCVAEAFALGCRALVSSTCNAQPQVFRRLYDAVQTGNPEEISAMQAQIKRYVDAMSPHNWVAEIKEALRHKGVDAGSVRPPLRNLDTGEGLRWAKKLKSIGVLE